MNTAQRRKKVVMSLNNVFATDPRVHREAKSLVDAGYDVTIFCVHKPGLPVAEEIDGIHVRRILGSYIRLPITRQARTIRATWRRALLEARADVYHGHDRDTLDETVRVAKELGAKSIYDSHEYWPDKNRYENNNGSLRDRLSELWWNLKERRYIKQVDALEVTSPGHGDGLVRRYGLAAEHGSPGYTLVRSIPEFQRGTDRMLLKRRFKLPADAFLLVYIGNVQRNRGIEEVITSLRHLPPRVHFAVIGYGPYQQELERRIPEELKGRVHFHERIFHRDIVPTLYSADVGMAPFQANCYSHYHVLPNKPFEYMLAELPIAASDFPDMRHVLDEVGAAVYFDSSKPTDIARAVRTLLENPQLRERMRTNERAATEKTYRWDVEKDSLLNLYTRLT